MQRREGVSKTLQQLCICWGRGSWDCRSGLYSHNENMLLHNVAMSVCLWEPLELLKNELDCLITILMCQE